MVLIDFLDNNIKDSLILVKSLRPSKMLLVGDKEDEEAGAAMPAEHMKEAVLDISRQGGFQLNVEIVPVDARDIEGILARVIEKTKSKGSSSDRQSEIYLNISGENDLMTAAAYNLCALEENRDRIIPVCVDTRDGMIRDVRTFEKVEDIRHIRLDDYLIAVGAKELDASRDEPDKEEFGAICAAAEFVFAHTEEWHLLSNYMGVHDAPDSRRIRIPADLGSRENDRHKKVIAEMLDVFCKYELLKNLGDDQYEFTSEKHKKWMLVYGTFLELYVYIKALPYVDEARIGMVLDWDADDGFDTKDNELDVVVIRDSRPVVISCKMRMPTKEDIYEVGYITNCLTGRSGRSAIATTAILRTEDGGKPGITSRFRKMEIGLIETIELRRDDACLKALF